MRSCNLWFLAVVAILTLDGCREEYTPKPYGFFRIDLPAKTYRSLPDSLPYQFGMAAEAEIQPDRDTDAEPWWINISYPQYNAKIHLSYKPITPGTSLRDYINDSHRLAFTHTIKAESIGEKSFRHDNIFGMIYLIEGNTASSTQFFVTDSTRHFLRGALYFNEHPAADSLAPVIEYLREDIIHLMETVRFR